LIEEANISPYGTHTLDAAESVEYPVLLTYTHTINLIHFSSVYVFAPFEGDLS